MSETKKNRKKGSGGGAVQPIAVLERKLESHLGWVNSVAVSPDSKWAATGSRGKGLVSSLFL